MAVNNNITTIPASRVPITDERTGLISREWYRYLNNQYTKTNQSANAVTPGDYGAIGDGAVDDSASIQAALDSGFDVYLPPGRIYAIGTTLTMSTPNQSFGGPGVLRIVGAINGLELISPTATIVTGIQLDLTFNSPTQTSGWAVYINNSSRVKINKLNIISGFGGLYVQQANWVVVDFMWASLTGPGVKWYGNDSTRSDLLILNSVVVDTGDTYYGMDWDGNCHSLTVKYLGIVGGKGMIIRNTGGTTTFPAIGRIGQVEVDYSTGIGVEIQAGLDYDFVMPYVLGAASDGFRIAATINAYEVRITGGKSIGNGGYGINNLGGVLLYAGDTSLYSNGLGEINGSVWNKTPRQAIDDEFYLTTNGGSPQISFAPTDYLAYNRTANELNLQIGGTGTVTFSASATQSYVPVYATGLRLLGSTTGYTGFSPSASGPSVTYTLPTAIGTSNQVLSTDGSNNLFWASTGGGVTSVTASSPVNSSGGATPNITVNATSGNTPLYLVQRNASGDFSANYITATGFYVDTYYYAQLSSGNPNLVFDNTDYLAYDRTANQYNFQIAGSGIFSLSATATQTYKPLRLMGSTSGYVGFTVPASAGSTTYTLPNADGTVNQVLSTNGAGTLSWATVSGGGGVTSVTATSPVNSSGGATPNITVNATSGNTPLYLVQRNGSGDFSGNFITAVGFYADATYYMQMSGASPNLVFDTNDYLAYDRTSNQYNFQIAGNGIFSLSATATQTYTPLRLMGSSSGYVGFTVPATAGSTTYSWPTSPVNGYFLQTDGSGNLSWAAASSGGVTSVGATSPVNSSGGTTPTISVNASSSNTASYLVQRDGAGDFSSRYITATGFYADATYYMQMSGADPNLVFDTNDYLSYDRTNNQYNFQIAGNGIFSMSATAIQAYKPIRILGSSSGYVGLTVPAAAGGTTYTLPSSDGSNGQFLKTDGSGGLTWASGNAGTVTSVTASSPVASSGGAAPNITISQATSSTDGYLSSTDWNTFNNKQAAGTYVTSVGATGPVVSSGGTTPTISVNAASANTSNYLVQRDGSGNFTAGTITAAQYTVGSNYYLTFSGANPIQVWNSSSYFSYDRTNDQLNSVIAGNGVFVLASTYAQSLKPLVLPQYTVATLPTGIQGAMAYVTDALTPLYNTTVVGGGSSVVRVFFDGTSWKT
jgi:hypothetical protein